MGCQQSTAAFEWLCIVNDPLEPSGKRLHGSEPEDWLCASTPDAYYAALRSMRQERMERLRKKTGRCEDDPIGMEA